MIFEELERKYDEVFTIKDLMDYLAIGKNKAYELVNSGEIPSFRIGRVIKIPKDGVREYVYNRKWKIGKHFTKCLPIF